MSWEVSMNRSTQFIKQLPSLEENRAPIDPVMHLQHSSARLSE